jgi:hypothetical protein
MAEPRVLASSSLPGFAMFQFLSPAFDFSVSVALNTVVTEGMYNPEHKYFR